MILGALVWRYVAGRKTAAPQLRPRFVGPDDDPEFLAGLDRRAAQEHEKLLGSWEEDRRRREEQLRRDDDGSDGPVPPA